MLPTNLVMVAPRLLTDNPDERHGVGVTPSVRCDLESEKDRSPTVSFAVYAGRTASCSSPVESANVSVIHVENPQTKIDSLLRSIVGPRNYQLWFRERTKLSVHDDELVVAVVSPFVLTLLQRQFRQEIGNVASSLLGPAARVRFEVDGSLSLANSEVSKTDTHGSDQADSSSSTSGVAVKTSEATVVSNVLSTKTVAATAKSPASTTIVVGPAMSEEGTRPAASANGGRRFAHLSDFVVGSCNQLAFAGVRQVSEAPGQRQNPLYLFGGVGLGKTHLLEGLYCELRRRFPTQNVVFLTSEQFANYFTHALRSHTLPSFRQRFRGIDVLLVDDVDFFDGKRGIQEEFLHTVKSLESHGKQIVVTADRHPNLLSQTSEELTSRFVSGLVCRMEAPDLDTRTKIVQHKLTRRDLQLAPDAVLLIAQWFRQNVRELEGALNCLEAHYSVSQVRLTAAASRQILADLQRDCVRIVRLADVERAICDLFRLIPDELRSASRSRNVSQPRMLAMFLARKLTQAAYSEIGEFFGGRNHSTVISAERQVQTWMTDETKVTIASRQWSVGELVQTLEQQLLAS
ncbi:MAG: chromosomal replication initiator protein DnaA [Planctomycetia bacterium]|nr:chromosomal replication initiator protein DnaA [Planctomycetia bacterium]